MEPIVSSIIETLGLGIFFYYLVQGLKTKISALETTIAVQGKTLDVMERRVQETQKVGDIYRKLIEDLPHDIDNYKTVISKTKDETILELQNENELTKRKLEEASRRIEESKNSPAVINAHLRVLKNMLSKPTLKEPSFKREYDLAGICQYGGRTLERCIPLIIECSTLEEFLRRAGFQVEISADQGILKTVFESRITPKGKPLGKASGSRSITGGWHLIANDEFYLNDIRLSELKDEFSAVKTMPG